MQKQTFRERLQMEMKRYMRSYLLKLRADMGLTKEEMAGLLHMDARSYSYNEDGTYLCSLMTFIALLRICPDKSKLLGDLSDIFKNVFSHEAA